MTPMPHHPSSEDLFAYRDGELSFEKRSLVEAHVLACGECRERMDHVSELESDLRLRPDAVGSEYYERLTESVLSRVGSLEPAGAPEFGGPPVVERRRPEPSPEGGRTRSSLRLPWFGVTGAAAAAAAVVVVVVTLVRHQSEWVNAPRPAVVGVPEGRGTSSDTSRAKRAASNMRAASGGRAAKDAREGAKPAAPSQAKPVSGEVAARRAPIPTPTDADALKNEAEGGRPVAQERAAADEKLQTTARPSAPQAALSKAAARDEASSPAYREVLRKHDLPATWDPSVPPGTLIAAENDLRLVYQTGRAGTDSARVRLYLAESERLRLGDRRDAAGAERVAHHYRRAIALALKRGDVKLAELGQRRLEDFLAVMGQSAP